jgi:ferredoxin-NADP reductase
VTIKTELHGYFSSWLAKNAEHDPEIKLSQPRGGFWLDLDNDRPAVCLVAGIGMTPAAAIARTVAERGSGHTLHIDYSAPLVGYFAHQPELEQLARDNANISLSLRVTGAGQRIQASDVAACVKRIPSARYFICGPATYQNAVRKYLLDAGVEEQDVHVETFAPVGRRIETVDQTTWRRRDIAVIVSGLALLVAYLVQAALGGHWAWLEALHAEEPYRRWSGALLTVFILAQWALPARRVQGASPKVTARAITQHRTLGAVAPLVFYAHTTHFGYAMLFALSATYFGNAMVGLFDKTWIKSQTARARYNRGWLPVHIAFSCLLIGLALVHIWVVFAYQGGVTP